jgi:transketolase
MYSKIPLTLHQKIANTLRVLSFSAIEKANSGHPGMASGLSSLATEFWHRMQFDPQDDQWQGRDLFILSAGHASALLYSLLYLWKMGVSLNDLKNFRQLHSITPGHPELGLTKGVEMTTGPLGQGVATSVGMALGWQIINHQLRALGSPVDHPFANKKVVVFHGDGCLEEGISYEAANLAGHWGLNQLVWVYDANEITIDGKTQLAWSEDIRRRFEAIHWRVLEVDGLAPLALQSLLDGPLFEQTNTKPTLVIAKTVIGYGSPNKAGTEAVHGSPLGAKEFDLTLQNLDWTLAPFEVPSEVEDYFAKEIERKKQYRKQWDQQYQEWLQSYPMAAEFWQKHHQPLAFESLVQQFLEAMPKGKMATRKSSNHILAKAYELYPEKMIGGSADLSGSNGLVFPKIKAYRSPFVDPSAAYGTKLFFGVREFAMTAILNGLSVGGTHWKAFGGTFLVFSDYARNAIRIAALSHIPIYLIYSHDSVFLGEDGPTHQPIESMWSLRLIPNLIDFRPADTLETALGTAYGFSQSKGPFCMILSRQDLPELQREADFKPLNVIQGGYLLRAWQGQADQARITLIGTGSEVSLCIEVAQGLAELGYTIHVVSMPSVNLFLAQSDDYQAHILGRDLDQNLLVSVEAGSGLPWKAITGIGKKALNISIDRFGVSAPDKDIAQFFGFTKSQIESKILEKLQSWL